MTTKRKATRRERRLEKAKRALLDAKQFSIRAELGLRKAHRRYIEAFVASWE